MVAVTAMRLLRPNFPPGGANRNPPPSGRGAAELPPGSARFAPEVFDEERESAAIREAAAFMRRRLEEDRAENPGRAPREKGGAAAGGGAAVPSRRVVRDAAVELFENGWHPIPTSVEGAGRRGGGVSTGKEPGLSGITGREGRYLEEGEILDWRFPGGLAVRCGPDVAGIDVDFRRTAEGKPRYGFARLAAWCGGMAALRDLLRNAPTAGRSPLPHRTYFFLLPEGDWGTPKDPCPGVEIIRAGHRLQVVYPSVLGGRAYWWERGGKKLDGPPPVRSLPVLPPEILRHLAGRTSPGGLIRPLRRGGVSGAIGGSGGRWKRKRMEDIESDHKRLHQFIMRTLEEGVWDAEIIFDLGRRTPAYAEIERKGRDAKTELEGWIRWVMNERAGEVEEHHEETAAPPGD